MAYDYPLVVVVLSTFNGERYLREQIDSLLKQTYKNIKIIIRDDGSKDGTCEILGYFLRKHKNIEVLFEKNIGVVASFIRLLDLISSDAEYVALCDQDDVWLEDKVERAVTMLGRVNSVVPSMYCGSVEVVDEKLKHISVVRKVKRKASLENALVQNVAIGCTVIINRPALCLVSGRNVAVNRIRMHDWWLYQVISTFGFVIYDDVPKIKYRQHGGNVVGSTSGIKLWENRIRRYISTNDRAIRSQANELLCVYGSEMPVQNYNLVSVFLEKIQTTMVGRLVYAMQTPVYRQSLVDNIILRMVIVLGRI